MTVVTSLFTGRAVALSSVPDPVFSGVMVAATGSRVRRGDPMMRWGPALEEPAGRSPVSPVAAALADLAEQGVVSAGETLFSWT